MWNIYVLKLKSDVSLFQQFVSVFREVSLFQRVVCTGFNGVGPEDVSLLERCPHFRRWYVHLSPSDGVFRDTERLVPSNETAYTE